MALPATQLFICSTVFCVASVFYTGKISRCDEIVLICVENNFQRKWCIWEIGEIIRNIEALTETGKNKQ